MPDPTTPDLRSLVERVEKALTAPQRLYVQSGAIHGDCTMATVNALRRKGLFHLVISSPNGQCGFMELTPLGAAVQSSLRALPTGADHG